MSVTNYTPSTDNGCAYNYSKLKDVVYLVSESHVKDVHIDNGYAYIDGLSELPLRINGFNIGFTETESLDERYRFTKKLTLSMHGYVNINFFGERYYAIIETTDGTFYMINVDFPSKVTYTFNLGQNTNQTDFTFSSQSNFPTLKIANEFEAVSLVCLGYNVYGIESLKLIEKNYVTFSKNGDTIDVNTYGGKSFRDVEFLGESCTFQEVYDGSKITDTISFDIGFDSYKTSWHYNLLEFLDNLYVARIIPKGGDNEYFVGFDFGLEPSYEINSTSSNGESDKITVKLVDASVYGMVAANDYRESQKTDTKWSYVKWVNGIKCYECVGNGRAQYLVQQEIDALGNPTGNYKVLQGYESMYTDLHVVGIFTTTTEFYTSECGEGDDCELFTNMPMTLYFDSVTCNTYSLSATSAWHIDNIPSYISISPSNGVADTLYNVIVCNTETPTSSSLQGTFNIGYCNKTRIENVVVQTDEGFIRPEHQYIDCLQQNVTFKFNSSCPISVISIDTSLTYNITNGQLVVGVPFNSSINTERVYPIIVEDCNGNRTTVYIHQDHVYEKWVVTDDYICQNGNSYKKLVRYTGTTSTNINTRTSDTKSGDIIMQNDPRCSETQTKLIWDGNYTCQDGNKYKLLEQFISYDSGQTWTKTGVVQLGELVETSSSWCDESAVTYSWVLTDKYQCGEDEDIYEYRWVTIDGEYTCVGFDKYNKEKKQQSSDGGSTWTDVTEGGELVTRAGSTLIQHNSVDCGYSDFKFKGYYSGGTTYSAECGSSSVLTSGDTHGVHTPISDLISGQVGTCVTEIGNKAFQDFDNVTAMTIPSTVTKIGEMGFEQCQKLRTLNLINVTSIGGSAFFNCWALNNITLNNNAVLGDACFSNCKSLREINIPTTYNYTKIGYNTFKNCSGLTTVTIPANIREIESEAFYGCIKLDSIVCKATTPPTLTEFGANNTIFTNTNECPIFVPDNSVDIYKGRWTAYRDRIMGMSQYEQWMEYLENLTASFSATSSSMTVSGTADDYMVGTFQIIDSSAYTVAGYDLTLYYYSNFTVDLIEGDEISYSSDMREYNTSRVNVGNGETDRKGTLALYLYRNSGAAKTATFAIYANFYSDEQKTTRYFKKNVGTIEITQNQAT